MRIYVFQRLIYMIFLLWLVSIVTFVVIQLPPGDYLSTYISRLEQAGQDLSDEEVENLRRQYGLNLPLFTRYTKWLGQVVQGNFGFSFDWQQPVKDIIGERLALTFTIAILSAIFTYAVAIPIGIYSATHQYSLGDYIFSFIGFIRAWRYPISCWRSFMPLHRLEKLRTQFDRLVFARVCLRALEHGQSSAICCCTCRFRVIVVGTAGTAGMIRVLRGTLLDELNKQYVITARSKGVGEVKLLLQVSGPCGAQPDRQRLGLALSFAHFRRRRLPRWVLGLAHRRTDAGIAR